MKRYWLPLTSVLTLTLVACPQPPAKTPPVIAAFTANPNALSAAGPSKLEWQVTDADTLSIDSGVGIVTGSSKDVNVSNTTTFTLTATNVAGSTTKSTTVTLSVPPTPPAPPTPPTPPTPPSPPPGPTAITKISGAITPWTRGQRQLKATTSVTTATYTLVSGNLTTDGSFEIPLNDPPQASLTVLATPSCTTLAVTPATLKGAAFTQFNVLTATNQFSGTLYYANAVASQGSSFTVGSKFAGYVYADQDAVLSGPCNGATIDWKLKKGWNLTLIERISATETKYTNDTIPSDFTWRFTPASGGTLKFDNPATNLEFGKSVQLNVTATEPDGTPITNLQLVWTSSDTSILEVTQTGVVTAKKLGTPSAMVSVSLKGLPSTTVITFIGIYGLEAVGGTFNLEGKTIGTAARIRYQPLSGSTGPTSINYTVTGPTGWNNNQPYSGVYKPGGAGQEAYGLLSEIPALNGTYQIRASDPSGTPLSNTIFNVNTALTSAPATNFKITGYTPTWSTEPPQPNLSWDPPVDLMPPYGLDDYLFLQVKDETTGQVVMPYQSVNYSPTSLSGVTWNTAHTYKIFLIALKGAYVGETRASRATVTRDFKPEITQVSVSGGAKGGGYSLTITGANFDLNTSVYFGTTEATSKTLQGSTVMQVVVPAGNAGTVDIKVTNAKGSSATTAATRFRYYEIGEYTVANASKLVAGGSGSVYFVEEDLTRSPTVSLAKIDSSGAITRLGLSGVAYSSLRDTTVDVAGNVWVAFETKVKRINSMNQVSEISLPTGVSAQMIAIGSDGNLWIARSDSDSITRMQPDGSNPTSFQITTGFFGLTFSAATEMLLAPDGNLWFTNSLGYGKITPAGSITLIRGYNSGSAMILSEGALWISAASSSGLTRVSMDGTATEYSNTCMNSARFARGFDNAFWCVGNDYPNYVYGLRRTVVAGSSATNEGIAVPTSNPVPVMEVIADTQGNLWFIQGNKIRKLTIN